MPEQNPNQIIGAVTTPPAAPPASGTSTEGPAGGHPPPEPTAAPAATAPSESGTTAPGRSPAAETGSEAKYKLTPQQILDLWQSVGGVREHGLLMAAIAVAESGGWVTAENVAGHSTHDLSYAPPYTSYSPTKDYSIGLWQLNFYQSLGPSRAKAWAALVGGPYGDAPTKFAQWLRTQPKAQATIARNLYDAGKGIGNWDGDPALAAWRAHGDDGLEPWLGKAILTGSGVITGTGGSGGGSGSGSGSGGTTITGNIGISQAPKSVVAPWNQLWTKVQNQGNNSHDAAKALKARLISAVGG